MHARFEDQRAISSAMLGMTRSEAAKGVHSYFGLGSRSCGVDLPETLPV